MEYSFYKKSGILHITPKVLYTFGGMIPEKWGHCSKKCKLGNEGCQKSARKTLSLQPRG